MTNKLYVGKLATGTTPEELTTFFSQVGEVLTVEISQKVSFQPNSGSAYVTMKNEADAIVAVEKLSNRDLKGSRVVVTHAHKIDQKGHSYYSSFKRRTQRR